MYVTHTSWHKKLSSLKAFLTVKTISQNFQVWENSFKFNLAQKPDALAVHIHITQNFKGKC